MTHSFRNIPYKGKAALLSKSHPPSEFIKRSWVDLFYFVKGGHIGWIEKGQKTSSVHIHNNPLHLKYTSSTHAKQQNIQPQHLVLSRKENFKGLCVSKLFL